MYNRSILRNSEIGSYFLDISSLYFREGHAILHQWVALTKSEGEDQAQVQGFLKLGVNLSGPDDSQAKLDLPALEKPENPILMPPVISTEFFQLIFRFFCAEGLPSMDITGGCDAYIFADFMGYKAQTKVITTKRSDVMWNQEISMPIRRPSVTSDIVFSVYDKDVTYDDYIGSLSCSVSGIEKSPAKNTRWLNIYGATPDSGESKYEKFYNENPKLASAWRGRVLIQTEGRKTDHPLLKCVDIPFPDDDPFVKALRTPKEYYVNASITMGICLPEKSEDLSAEIKIGEYSFKSDPASTKQHGRCYFFNWFCPANSAIKLPYDSIDSFPDVFLYIREGKHYYSFKRMKANKFVNPDVVPQWTMLEENLCDGNLNGQHNCGMVQFSLSITPTPVRAEQKRLTEHRSAEVYDVFIHIFQCKDLPASDQEGTSDPYVSIFTMADKPVTTSIVYGTLNPVAFDALSLE